MEATLQDTSAPPPDARLAALAEESDRLKATIAKQQEQINALLQRQQQDQLPKDKKTEVTEDPEAQCRWPKSRLGNWTCSACTFQNIEPLKECEMCGASRPSEPQLKRRRTLPPIDVSDEPCEASREFLRQATKVVPTNSQASLGREERGAAADIEMAEVPPPEGSGEVLNLPRKLYEELCPYQREGVAWMWQLYHRKQGGILADEMGLGKTVQACALIQALGAGAHVMVVMPVTLLDQWARELQRWCPKCPVYIYHGSAGHRLRALRAMQRGGVLLTSYAIVKNEEHKLASVNALEIFTGAWLGKTKKAGIGERTREKLWDAVICDEAHVMRTISTLLGKAMRNVKARCRILLTGTPVQNALQDLWALMDFAEPGLLGNHATFTKRFNDPIEPLVSHWNCMASDIDRGSGVAGTQGSVKISGSLWSVWDGHGGQTGALTNCPMFLPCSKGCRAAQER